MVHDAPDQSIDRLITLTAIVASKRMIKFDTGVRHRGPNDRSIKFWTLNVRPKLLATSQSELISLNAHRSSSFVLGGSKGIRPRLDQSF